MKASRSTNLRKGLIVPNWCHTRLEVEGPTSEVFSFVQGLGIEMPPFYAGGCSSILDTYFPAPAEFDNSGEWVHDNWGSKWSDCHTQYEAYEGNDTVAVAVFSFDSAWSPLSEGLRNVSERFPLLRFEMSHDEEAGFFCGVEVLRAGEVCFSEFFVPEESYKEQYGTAPDFDTEEGSEKYDAIKWDTFYQLEQAAQKVGRL